MPAVARQANVMNPAGAPTQIAKGSAIATSKFRRADPASPSKSRPAYAKSDISFSAS